MLGGTALILASQRRAAARPRPGDAIVTAVFTVADYQDKGTAEVVVAIANPGGSPCLSACHRGGGAGRGAGCGRRSRPGRPGGATVPTGR